MWNTGPGAEHSAVGSGRTAGQTPGNGSGAPPSARTRAPNRWPAGMGRLRKERRHSTGASNLRPGSASFRESSASTAKQRAPAPHWARPATSGRGQGTERGSHALLPRLGSTERPWSGSGFVQRHWPPPSAVRQPAWGHQARAAGPESGSRPRSQAAGTGPRPGSAAAASRDSGAVRWPRPASSPHHGRRGLSGSGRPSTASGFLARIVSSRGDTARVARPDKAFAAEEQTIGRPKVAHLAARLQRQCAPDQVLGAMRRCDRAGRGTLGLDATRRALAGLAVPASDAEVDALGHRFGNGGDEVSYERLVSHLRSQRRHKDATPQPWPASQLRPFGEVAPALDIGYDRGNGTGRAQQGGRARPPQADQASMSVGQIVRGLRAQCATKRSLRCVFLEWDRDKDGRLGQDEVRAALEGAGYRVSTSAVQRLCQRACADPAGRANACAISYCDFTRLVSEASNTEWQTTHSAAFGQATCSSPPSRAASPTAAAAAGPSGAASLSGPEAGADAALCSPPHTSQHGDWRSGERVPARRRDVLRPGTGPQAVAAWRERGDQRHAHPRSARSVRSARSPHITGPAATGVLARPVVSAR